MAVGERSVGICRDREALDRYNRLLEEREPMLMPRWETGFWLPLSLLLLTGALAQDRPTPRKGPLLKDFGPVFEVPNPDLVTPREDIYRVVFEVAESPEDKSRLNARLETVARFLNMHAGQGIPLEQMHLALVIHGGAGKDTLKSDAYRGRYGVDNPNEPLLEALHGLGVQIYLCGQTAASRGLPKEELLPSVGMALSAMTALLKFQSDGYQLIAF